MTLEEFNQYCLAKPGVTADYPFKGECVWMKVLGKMFALANVQAMKMDGQMVDTFHFINLKCSPDKALELREAHAAIVPGWHQNKEHWNTLYMDGSLEHQLVKELVDHSYDIVLQSLPKKQKDQLTSH